MCFFEINYIMKSVIYPGLFHSALHISRMVDIAPELELKAKLLNTQRELTKSLLALEMVCKTRMEDPDWDESKALEFKPKEEKKDGEEKKDRNAKELKAVEAGNAKAEKPP